MSILDTPVAGLPLDAWLLLAVAVGVGLGLELAFWRAHRRDAAGPVDDVTRSGHR